MATTTIPRSSWTDDDGTGRTGSIINNAELQKIYANVDTVIAGDITWGGAGIYANAKTFGFADGFFARVGANAVKFWNGTTLGAVTCGTPLTVGTIDFTSVDANVIAIGKASVTTSFVCGESVLNYARMYWDNTTGSWKVDTKRGGVFITGFQLQDGVITVGGRGVHGFIGSGAGLQVVQAQNTTDSTTTYSAFQCLNAAGDQSLTIRQNANSFTTSGYLLQGAGVIVETAAAGISFANTNSAADFRFYCGTSTTQRFTIFASGGVSIGDTTDPGSTNLRVVGTVAIGTKYVHGSTPTASTGTIQGSGGSAQTVVALPASSYGIVHVFMKRTLGSVFSYHAVFFVTSGASAQIYTPVNPFLNAQLNFTLSGLNLQAKSSEATAPDSVVYTTEVFTQ